MIVIRCSFTIFIHVAVGRSDGRAVHAASHIAVEQNTLKNTDADGGNLDDTFHLPRGRTTYPTYSYEKGSLSFIK